jgi:sugar phosphate isomerase/epimerase
MTLHRRAFTASAAGAAIAAVLGLRPGATRAEAAAAARFRIGGCDWSLGKEGDPGSFALAKEAGLDGVEISCGKPKETLPIADPDRLHRFQEAAKAAGLPVCSTCLEVLHRDALKSHPDAPKWVEQAIAPTRELGAKTLLLPGFFKQSYETREEQQVVADRLKALAPLAEKAGVVLALENVLAAEDNLWILEKAGSPAVKVYYDVENPVQIKHFDPVREIGVLGKAGLGQIHLKDKAPVFGEGRIDFPKVIEAILKTGFEGWLVIETYATPKDVKGVFAGNARYIRGLLG